MRLIFFNYEYPPLGGGAGNATAHIAREASLRGHEVMVVTSAFRGLPASEERDGYLVRRVPTVRRRAEQCAAWEMAVYMVSAALAGPFLARGFRPDATLAFFGIPSGPAAWLLGALRGAPYGVSLRGGDVPGFQPYDLARAHRLTGPVIRFLWRRAAFVAANSHGLKSLAEKSAGAVPIHMIPNGVDTGVFRPPSERDGDGVIRMLFVGRVVRQKGLDVLLEALARIEDRSVKLWIAGDGPAKVELAAQAHRLGLTARVRFLGWRERAEMPELYRRVDMFVFPSRDEGMPNAVLEAMASGLPVAATRISGNEELVRDGLTGYLVPPDDPAALAGALERLVADADGRRAMGLAGRAAVLADYSWGAVAEAYLALLGRAV